MIASISMDDGTAYQFNHALPILEEFKVNVTWALCHNLLSKPWRYDEDHSIITKTEVEFLRRRGDEIADHTPNHLCSLEVNDYEILEKEYTSNPFNATTFVYPRGHIELKDKLKEVYKCARSCDRGTIIGEPYDIYELPLAFFEDAVKDWDWAIFYFHLDVDKDLSRLLTILEDRGVEIMVIKDALQEIL